MILPRRFIPGGFPVTNEWPNISDYTFRTSGGNITGTTGYHGFDIKFDGTRIWYCQEEGGSLLQQRDLNTAWDSYDVGTEVNAPAIDLLNCTGLRIRQDDGTSIWRTRSTGTTREIRKTLTTTAYDITSATVVGNSKDISAWVTAAATLQGLFIRQDTGNTVWTISSSGGNGILYEFPMPTAWGVTSITAPTSVSRSGLNGARDIFFKPDGMRLYALQSTVIQQWNLTTAWDKSTLGTTPDYTLFIGDGSSTPYPLTPHGLSFNINDGSSVYVLSGAQTGNVEMYQYDRN